MFGILFAVVASTALAGGEIHLRGKSGNIDLDDDTPLHTPLDWYLSRDGTWRKVKRDTSWCRVNETEGEWVLEPDGTFTIPTAGDDYVGRMAAGRALARKPADWEGYIPFRSMQRVGAEPLLYSLLSGESDDEHWVEVHLYDDGRCWYTENHVDHTIDPAGRCRPYAGVGDDLCSWWRDPGTGLPVIEIEGVEPPTTSAAALGCLDLHMPERTVPVCVY